MIGHWFFYLAVTFMLLHEMDAVRCREWRIFPGLSLLRDEVGFQVFMLTHLPLYGLFFWAVMEQSTPNGVIRGLNLFFVVHLVLHLLYLKHPKNEFKGIHPMKQRVMLAGQVLYCWRASREVAVILLNG